MFCLNDTMRYFLCPGKTDMRKGMNSLCGVIHNKMGYDVRLGDVFIFINRQILARPGFLHDCIFPAAGVGTGSLIGVPSGEIVAQKAAAGIGNAHGSVDEGLDLQIVGNVRPDLLDLLH